jgi:hypothetical protein
VIIAPTRITFKNVWSEACKAVFIALISLRRVAFVALLALSVTNAVTVMLFPVNDCEPMDGAAVVVDVITVIDDVKKTEVTPEEPAVDVVGAGVVVVVAVVEVVGAGVVVVEVVGAGVVVVVVVGAGVVVVVVVGAGVVVVARTVVATSTFT